MPIFALLFGSIGTAIFNLVAFFVGAKYAVRLLAVASLAAIYISCVVYYSNLVGPWLAGVFASQYGQFLGLLFPPISGSIVAGLGVYWTCIIGVRYTTSLTKMAVG